MSTNGDARIDIEDRRRVLRGLYPAAPLGRQRFDVDPTTSLAGPQVPPCAPISRIGSVRARPLAAAHRARRPSGAAQLRPMSSLSRVSPPPPQPLPPALLRYERRRATTSGKRSSPTHLISTFVAGLYEPSPPCAVACRGAAGADSPLRHNEAVSADQRRPGSQGTHRDSPLPPLRRNAPAGGNDPSRSRQIGSVNGDVVAKSEVVWWGQRSLREEVRVHALQCGA
jgi:hypothetical protein